jgi:hypothetical protein
VGSLSHEGFYVFSSPSWKYRREMQLQTSRNELYFNLPRSPEDRQSWRGRNRWSISVVTANGGNRACKLRRDGRNIMA